MKNKPVEIEKEEKNNPWWIYLLQYGISISLGIGLFFLTLSLRDFFTTDLPLVEKYRFIADGFTIPGILFLFSGLLVWVSSQGALDGLMFGLSRLGKSLLPFLFKNKNETYDEFLDKRKRPTPSLFLFVVGGLFLILAIIFIALFYKEY